MPKDISTLASFGRLVGKSAQMRRLYPICQRLAASTVPVLIEGEPGTGKQLVAASLHEESARAQAPFIVFDCAAVPPSLVESELFGHEPGAFMGSAPSHEGSFERADGGTLVLREIGDLGPALQSKLLRAIEHSQVRRVGGDHALGVDVRVLATTRRSLDHAVAAGRYRKDLHGLLSVARIELPPLRARRGDVLELALHFCASLGGDPGALGEDPLRRWERYAWPGNVRELRNAVAGHLARERARSPTDQELGDVIDRVLALDLPLAEGRARVLEELERRYLERAVARVRERAGPPRAHRIR